MFIYYECGKYMVKRGQGFILTTISSLKTKKKKMNGLSIPISVGGGGGVAINNYLCPPHPSGQNQNTYVF